MPIPSSFTPNSKEWNYLEVLASVLSKSTNLHEIGEVNEAQLLAQTVVGAHVEPLDGNIWSEEQLAKQILRVGVFWPDEDGHELLMDGAIMTCPVQRTEGVMYVRRYLRESEIKEHGKEHCINWFTDRLSAAAYEIVKLSLDEHGFRIEGGVRSEGPMIGNVRKAAGQGNYLWATYQFELGNLNTVSNQSS